MEIEENNGEQLLEATESPATEVAQEVGEEVSSEGSPFGKFKDAESLFEAYNNLQAEFTRKCQRLSELERQPKVYEGEEWNKKVADFLSTHEEAKQYSEEIAKLVLEDPNISREDNALELAWAKVALSKYKNPEKVLEDEDMVLEFIDSHEGLKSKILEGYLEGLKEKRTPTLISSSGKRLCKPMESEVHSLEEAKRKLEEMFNN